MHRRIIFLTAGSLKGVSMLATNTTKPLQWGVPAMAPTRNPCVKAMGGVKCTSGPSTLIIVIAGMCAMMLLVVVAILLLFFSHFRYRRRLRSLQQFNHQQSMVIEASLTPPLSNSNGSLDPPHTTNSCDGIILVLLPGDKHASSCAKPCPLFLETPTNACDPRTIIDIKDKVCN
ncbi:hypothetical protein GOP47_0002014 [Adiantum capillus-veneris]|uniref:Uncharacterized protein n=1 Tax=Adiantum capillus-veneris TaxID=13818 RepID=A0A9D4ZQL5_ADICA|nr:hypothetical protein GOP47_0002014 [Adiantum capillus-veneris]